MAAPGAVLSVDRAVHALPLELQIAVHQVAGDHTWHTVATAWPHLLTVAKILAVAQALAWVIRRRLRR